MADAATDCPSATRLALCDHSDQRGTVDGAWWPPDYLLRTALVDLVSVMGLPLGSVRRVLYDPSLFPLAPSRIIRGNTAISVDQYSLVSRDTIYLMGTHARNALLYVVPPDTAADRAGDLLEKVADAARPVSVRMLRAMAAGRLSPVREMG
ncbi:DUF5994 family protein [Mycobacterium sp. AMU20-3851]|uniref:DUF5994 family protein n=1 Tax=Mycobacterium sp. AMU20-3851 TaxID=3122055 RepID=UPI00375406F1